MLVRHPTPTKYAGEIVKCFLSELVLARWWRLVAFVKAMNLLHPRAMLMVWYHGYQSGYILHLCFVCCFPDGHRGNTEQVVAQWQRPVASVIALDMLHRTMPHVLLQRLRVAIEMACDGDAFVRRRRLFCLA